MVHAQAQHLRLWAGLRGQFEARYHLRQLLGLLLQRLCCGGGLSSTRLAFCWVA